MTVPGHPRIDARFDVCGGRPVIVGTRMRVVDILELLAGGMSAEEIAADYPYVTVMDVRAALNYAAESQRHPIVAMAAE
jgi:uncharacterized protein (DUF433 family)